MSHLSPYPFHNLAEISIRQLTMPHKPYAGGDGKVLIPCIRPADRDEHRDPTEGCGAWLLHTSHRLSRSAKNELMGILGTSSNDAWLCDALSGGYMRSTGIPENEKLGAARFYAFPISGTSQVILAARMNNPSTRRGSGN
jgi:hypothetical protein